MGTVLALASAMEAEGVNSGTSSSEKSTRASAASRSATALSNLAEAQHSVNKVHAAAQRRAGSEGVGKHALFHGHQSSGTPNECSNATCVIAQCAAEVFDRVIPEQTERV